MASEARKAGNENLKNCVMSVFPVCYGSGLCKRIAPKNKKQYLDQVRMPLFLKHDFCIHHPTVKYSDTLHDLKIADFVVHFRTKPAD
jgi:hypothetical protein